MQLMQLEFIVNFIRNYTKIIVNTQSSLYSTMGNKPLEFNEDQKTKLNEGKPVFLCDGIKITKNTKTGKLQGVPQQWANNYDLPMQVDYSKLVKTSKLPQSIRANEQLPEQIIKLINSQPIQITWPTSFEHKIHLEVDLNKPYGFKNIPKQWQLKLNESFISQSDIISNPQGTISIIKGFSEELKQSQIENQILSTKQFQDVVAQIKFIQENPGLKFVFQNQLGKGAMCKVYFSYDKSHQDRKYYACRIIKLKDKRTLKKIRVQVAVMSLCNAQNLTKHYFTYYYQQSLFMFVEFMDGGALTDLIYKFMNKIPENVIAYIMKSLLIALNSLHQKKQLHRDLKSDNILLNLKGDVKIADFGFAIQLTKQQLNRKSQVGTPAWMAPQLVQKKQYNEKVDIWSLGMIAIELCVGQPPYLRQPHLKAMHNIVTKQPPELPDKFSQQLCHFVSCCLKKEPHQRWSACELLNHKFLNKMMPGKNQRQKLIQMLKHMKKSSLQSIIKNVKQ